MMTQSGKWDKCHAGGSRFEGRYGSHANIDATRGHTPGLWPGDPAAHRLDRGPTSRTSTIDCRYSFSNPSSRHRIGRDDDRSIGFSCQQTGTLPGRHKCHRHAGAAVGVVGDEPPVPGALASICPMHWMPSTRAPTKPWAWHWVFPPPVVSIDPGSGIERRHHLFEQRLQRGLKQALEQAGAERRLSRPGRVRGRTKAQRLRWQ